MEPTTIHEDGYRFALVNIDCLRSSTSFNVVMDMDDSIEELLPYLAAVLPGCTYIHGTGVINLMDDGHIVAIYPKRITLTDAPDKDTAVRLCRSYFENIRDVKARREQIAPQYERRPSITLLAILRHLPQTNCGRCRCPTCMAFAAQVFRRETPISACELLMEDAATEKVKKLLQQLQTDGYVVPGDSGASESTETDR
jgi:ArsR family metal-binding transcriptional regulator